MERPSDVDGSYVFQIVLFRSSRRRGVGGGRCAVVCRLRRASNPRERSGEPTGKRLTPALFSVSTGVVLFASNTPFLTN